MPLNRFSTAILGTLALVPGGIATPQAPRPEQVAAPVAVAAQARWPEHVAAPFAAAAQARWLEGVPASFAAATRLPASPALQQTPRLPLQPESRVWVDGTSNKNDWTVKATQLSGFVNLRVKGDMLEIAGGGFTVVAKSLVSEHGVIMDRLMQGALKSAAHPDIVYELGSATATPQPPGKYAVATQGRVTIAGVTKDVAQTVMAERLPGGQLRFTGSQPVLMSEYGMTPPTAMFGALRTGNRVVVNFELVVKP